MKKLFFTITIVLLAAVWGASLKAQEVNMDVYITITVKQKAQVKFDLMGLSTTEVKVVNGSKEEIFTINRGWTGDKKYIAETSVITIYGDVAGFDCGFNYDNLTAINVSHNTLLSYLAFQTTQVKSIDVSKNINLEYISTGNAPLTSLDVSKNIKLKKMHCHGNKFNAQAFDDLYCSLPNRTNQSEGIIQVIWGRDSENHNEVLNSNATNANNKNWRVQYCEDDKDIPTTGKYICPTSNLEKIDAVRMDIYPNPVEDILYVQSDSEVHIICIYDIYGKEVARATNSQQIDVSHLPSGLYMANINTLNGTAVRRIIKR
ncbi:hypothetical protein HW49_01910 [Porphyromonadaceae bacterium COT-184 OH4590]|nr:hypothetical protein HW49_01910 [Porphyromonadaceae bacterium COT-184 OH4590]